MAAVLEVSEPAMSGDERGLTAAAHALWYVGSRVIAHVRPISPKQYAERAPISPKATRAGARVARVGARAQQATPAGRERKPPHTMFFARLTTDAGSDGRFAAGNGITSGCCRKRSSSPLTEERAQVRGKGGRGD